MYSAREIINRRKALWEADRDFLRDQKFVNDLAEWLTTEPAEPVRQEVKDRPELLIEMLFYIVNKVRETVPFFLNNVQQDFADHLYQARYEFKMGRRLDLKFLVLKGRQQGFTSLITAYQLSMTITHRNFSGFTLADNAENTESIFSEKAKFPYDNLPDCIKPTEKINNRRELLFSKLNSRWRMATAGGKDVGRSRTLQFFHGSEVAFWDDLPGLMKGLGPALTKDSIQILESTANGYNSFKDRWDEDNSWESLFFEWWRTPEYTLKFESRVAEVHFTKRVSKAKKKTASEGEEWVYSRCRWLKEEVGLDWGQVYWYYHTWKEYGEDIKQEYPCSAEEAFMASGKCIFDQEQIIRRQKVVENIDFTQGYFHIKWHNPDTMDRIVECQFIESDDGYIYIYKEPEKGVPYVLGGDTKGEGSDFFASTVVNNLTGERVASLHGDMDSDEYTYQTYALGMYYNTALIGIEVNFNTYPVEELQRLDYPRQYVRRHYDTYTGTFQKKFGFKTDRNTRPLIIEKMKILIRDHIELFYDIVFLDECLTFVKDDKGRPDALPGHHDDLLFSSMIAEEIREQQDRIPDFGVVLEGGKLPLSGSGEELPQDLLDDFENAPEEQRQYLLKKWGYIKEASA